jgi:hypothetical protein
MEERKRLADVMQQHWNGVEHTMQDAQPGLYSSAKATTRGTRQPNPQQIALGTPRLGWGDRVAEETVITCERAQQVASSSQATSEITVYPPHRIYVRKKGNVVCAATSLVHGVR